jgi:hypothetical protein
MKQKIVIALTLTTSALSAVPAFAAEATAPQRAEHRRAPSAEDKARHEARRKEWEAMTPEQREAKLKAHRAEREARMTPEQKAQHEARRKEWEAMTPEQRAAKKAEMKPRGGDRPHRERPAQKAPKGA